MAITFTSVSLQDKSSILRPIGAEFAAFGTAGASMANKIIYVDLGMFVNSGDAQPAITEVPKYGYRVAFPASGTVTMDKTSNTNYFLWKNGNVKLQRTAATTFTLTIEALMTMDLQGMLSYQGIDTLDRLRKNAKSNPARNNNNAPAVYNEAKVLRFLVVVAETDDSVIEYGYLDVPFNSRWVGLGLNGGTAEYSNFDYKFITLSAYGTPPGFSLNTDTTIRFYITGTWTGGGCIQIWKDTNNSNANEFKSDTDWSGTYFDNAGALSQVFDFNNSAFVSAGAVTLITGSSYYIDVVFDKDYFEKDGVYRIALLPFKTNDYSNTFLTEQLLVTDYMVPTTGDITDTIENYSIEANSWQKCGTGSQIHERHRFTVEMDKESYNDNIVTNESTGTFDDNFLEVKMYLSDSAIPDGNSFDTKTAELITDLGFINTSTEAGAQTTIIMRPEWAGTIKYVTTVFRFKILFAEVDDVGQFVIDEIYYQQSFYVDNYLTEDDEIEVVSVKNLETDDDITEICGDTGIIQVVFKNNTEKTFDLIAYLYGENDPYKATGFVKLNSAAIFNMNKEFVGENLAVVNIDTSLLPYGVASCIELIGINRDHILGACPTSGSLSVSLIAIGSLNIQVTFSGLDVEPQQVEIRLTPVTDKPIIGLVDKEFTFFETSGDTGVFLGYGNDIWKTYNINVVVKTLNNCLLSGSAVFQVSKLIDDTDTQTINLT